MSSFHLLTLFRVVCLHMLDKQSYGQAVSTCVHVYVHPTRPCDSLAKKLVTRLPATESPAFVKHTWAMSNPKLRSFVASGPPLVSMFVDLHFVCTLEEGLV